MGAFTYFKKTNSYLGRIYFLTFLTILVLDSFHFCTQSELGMVLLFLLFFLYQLKKFLNLLSYTFLQVRKLGSSNQLSHRSLASKFWMCLSF